MFSRFFGQIRDVLTGTAAAGASRRGLAPFRGPVIGTLTFPNGEVIRTIREDVFQAALASAARKAQV
jgi:hypothetical protein